MVFYFLKVFGVKVFVLINMILFYFFFCIQIMYDKGFVILELQEQEVSFLVYVYIFWL